MSTDDKELRSRLSAFVVKFAKEVRQIDASDLSQEAPGAVRLSLEEEAEALMLAIDIAGHAAHLARRARAGLDDPHATLRLLRATMALATGRRRPGTDETTARQDAVASFVEYAVEDVLSGAEIDQAIAAGLVTESRFDVDMAGKLAAPEIRPLVVAAIRARLPGRSRAKRGTHALAANKPKEGAAMVALFDLLVALRFVRKNQQIKSWADAFRKRRLTPYI